MRDGLIPAGFNEGPIDFAPTYKFDKGTDTYDTRYASIWLPFDTLLEPCVVVRWSNVGKSVRYKELL